MRVTLSFRAVTFYIADHKLTIYPRGRSLWLYLDGEPFLPRTRKELKLVERILNGEMRLIHTLRWIALRYESVETRGKYLRCLAELGWVEDSRKLTRELKKRASARSKNAFEISAGPWRIFAGPFPRAVYNTDKWIAYFVNPERMEVREALEDGLFLKALLFEVLEGKRRVSEIPAMRVIKVDEMLMLECAKHWKLKPFEDLVSILLLKRKMDDFSKVGAWVAKRRSTRC